MVISAHPCLRLPIGSHAFQSRYLQPAVVASLYSPFWNWSLVTHDITRLCVYYVHSILETFHTELWGLQHKSFVFVLRSTGRSSGLEDYEAAIQHSD